MDTRFFIQTISPQWTVNKESNTFLRYMRCGRDEFSNQLDFVFYFKDRVIDCRFEVEAGGVRNGPGWSAYKKIFIKIPDDLKSEQDIIIEEIKRALTAYKGGGVGSTRTVSGEMFYF